MHTNLRCVSGLLAVCVCVESPLENLLTIVSRSKTVDDTIFLLEHIIC